MTDDGIRTNDRPELRPIVTRLVDLQRKCRSVGTRNDEAADMAQRISSILERLGSDPGDEVSIPFAALARELFPVERFFESNGFLSIAKEVAHVERALETLAPEDRPPIGPSPTVAATSSAEPVAAPSIVDEEGVEHASRWAVPRPVLATLLLLVIAVAVCVVVIIRSTNPGPAIVPEAALADPAPTPTATAGARPTPAAPNPDATPGPGARLAENVGKARLALADGDIEAAIDSVSVAALIDADDVTVLATADQIVDLLVLRADNAALAGDWEGAELTLARARRMATRFGFDTHDIDQMAHRHGQMKRFRILRPGDVEAIRAATGRPVIVFLLDGGSQEALIKDVRGGELLLDEDTTVRGGTMFYVEHIPLDTIDYLKVWED